MNNGKISNTLLTVILIILAAVGFIASNTEILKGLMGPYYLRFGIFIGLLALAFYNYYFPRLKKVVESGEDVTIDNGKISTFLATLITIISGVVMLDPTAFQSIFGSYGGIAYTLVTLATAWYNGAYPRNAQFQPPEVTDGIKEGSVA